MAGGDSSHSAESFRGLLLRHRGRTGLTQRDLAANAGVSRRTVQDWEAGLTLPTSERLQALIRALLASGGLAHGQEMQEARELWSSVEREGARALAAFDAAWFAGLLDPRAPLNPTRTAPIAEPQTEFAERAHDWGDAPDGRGFVGRQGELELLRQWVIDDHCRLLALLGMGGIGKTSLAARLAQTVAPNFERLYWRSLRNAPSVSDWMAGAIGFLSDQQLAPPTSESDRISALLRLLRAKRCLLVLDNSETVFEPGQGEGRYRPGMDGYGRVFQAVGEASHQSCMVLTSREAPPELVTLAGGVQALELRGLGTADAQTLLADKQLTGDAESWLSLVARYGGNGLALKIVGETIRQVYGGDVQTFLRDANEAYGTVFGGIRRLLDAQAERISPIERDVLTRMAVEREPVKLAQLSAEMVPAVSHASVIEAIETLRRRSFVERGDAGATFALQSMVLEYITDRLVETAADEIARGDPGLLVDQPLIKARAKDYVRQTQELLIGKPILELLRVRFAEASADARLVKLLERWRGRPITEQGYGPGNVVNLLRLLRGDLHEMDLSRLSLRQAYLAEVNAQDASLVDAHLVDSVLADGFDLPGSVALSSSGALLASGTATGRIWLWHVADRKLLLTVHGHTGVVRGVAISGDERLMASGGVDGTISLWDTSTGQRLAVLPSYTTAIRTMALSTDAHVLVSGSDDGNVRVWSTSTHELQATLRGHSGIVRSVAVSANGRLIASGGVDGTVRVWNTQTGQLLTTLRGHENVVRGVAISADGRRIISCGDDATVRVWNAETGQNIGVLRGHTGFVMSLALSADARLAVSASFDDTLRVWDVERQELVAILHGHTGTLFKLTLSSDGRVAATASNDGTLRLWDIDARRLITTLQGYPSVIWRVALSDDGAVVASTGAEGTVRVWNTHTGQPVSALRSAGGMLRVVALTGDTDLVASGSLDGTVCLWQVRSGRMLTRLHGHTGGTRALSLSADGRLMASGGADALVKLWRLPDGEVFATLRGHSGWIRGVAVSRDGSVVASCGDDASVRLWSAANAASMHELHGHVGIVWDVALSSDGRVLASAGNDGTVMLWDVTDGQRTMTLQGHSGGVHGVALSGDGAIVASGGVDAAVRLWDTRTGNLLSILFGHSGAIWDVALSADGRLAASGSDDGTLKIWDARSGECLHSLRGDRLYQRLDITGLTGTTDAQRAALFELGAIENQR